MKKYVVWTITTGDWFQEFFETENDAVAYADADFARQGYAKNHRILQYFVALCELDEDGVPNLDSADVIKEYK